MVEKALKQGWNNLSKDVQEALKGVGVDFTPEPECQPLEEVTQGPPGVAAQGRHVEGILKPAPAAIDVTRS